MELKEVISTGMGGGYEKYVVRPDEVVAARIGFTATNHRERAGSLPVHGILEGDEEGYVSRDMAEHVVAGNVAFLSQLHSEASADADLCQGPRQTVESGLEALAEGHRQLAAIVNS